MFGGLHTHKKMKIKFANSTMERIIISIDSQTNYAAKVAKEINSSHTDVTKIIIELEKSKIVDRNKDGRIIYLALTEKGLRLQNLLKELKNEN